MRRTIFYFSATGNSLEIARKIAKELGDCAIKPMAAQAPGETAGGLGEYVGFIFPVFYNGLPRLVKRFVERLALNPEKEGVHAKTFSCRIDAQFTCDHYYV